MPLWQNWNIRSAFRAPWRLGPACGLGGSVLSIVLIEAAKAAFGVAPMAALLLPATLFATLIGGVWTGAASALLVLSYGAYHYLPTDSWMSLGILSLATIATVAMAGWWISASPYRAPPAADQDTARATARRYRRLVEDLDLIYWEGRPNDEGFAFVSPRIVDLLGYPLGRWLEPGGAIMDEVVHPEDREHLEQVCNEAREKGEDYALDFRLIARDGRVVWVHSITRLIPTAEGGYVAHGVVVDITDRRKAEQALQAVEQRFQMARDLSLEAFGILEPIRNANEEIVDLRWDHLNAAAARLWDARPEQLQGRCWSQMRPQPQNEHLFSQIVRVAETGDASDTEFPFHSDRGDGWLRSMVTRVNGRVAISLSDISEQRMVKQALRESEQRFRTLAESAPIPIWLAGPDKLVTYLNKAWLDLTGRAMTEELGTGWIRHVHPEDRARIEAIFDEAAKNAAPFRMEYRVQRHNGVYRWLIDQGAPRYLPDGTFAGFVGVCVDITDRKQVEQQLEDRVDQQDAVVNLGQAALADTPLGELMQQAVAHVARTLEVNTCMLMRHDAEADAFVLEAATGRVEGEVGDRAPVDRSTAAGRCLKVGTPIIFNNGTDHAVHPDPPFLKTPETAGRLTLPVPDDQDAPYGVLAAYAEKPRPFTEDDVKFVQTVAHILAAAIHRQKAEQALRLSEMRFRSMFDQAAVGIAHAEPDGRFTAVNQRLCEMLDYSSEELRGMDFRRITFADDLSADEAQAQRLVRGEIDQYTLEKRFVRRDGSLLWTELTCSGVRGTGGELLFVVGIIADISRRKQAEQELRQFNETLEQRVTERTAELAQSEETLRKQTQVLQSILDSIGEGIVVSDMHGRFVVWNPAAERLVGPAPDVAPEQWGAVSTLYKPDGTVFSTEELPLSRAMAGESLDECDVLVQRPDAPLQWLLVTARPLRDADGTVRGGVAVLHDATARRAAERKLRDYQIQLRTLASELTQSEQRERRRLAQTLHDHLQQILVAAQLRVGVVRNQADGASFAEALGQVGDLINEAIEASRSLTLELSPPILYDAGLVAATRWLGRQMEFKHGLRVEVETDFEDDQLSEDVRIFLFQALRELLFNVVKHANISAARVRLERREDGGVRMSVEDHGRGFDAERVAEASQEGFGLFSIRERVKLIGGTMSIQSSNNKGARITLTTPAAPEQKEPEAAADVAEATAPVSPAPLANPRPDAGQVTRVLLADDHKVLRAGLAALLRQQPGIEVVGEASDGKAAVELVPQARPDVVVMDVTMPGLDGVEATRQIMQLAPAVRVVGLSMHDGTEMATAMREAGAVAYLTKGGPPEELIQAIHDASPCESSDASGSRSTDGEAPCDGTTGRGE